MSCEVGCYSPRVLWDSLVRGCPTLNFSALEFKKDIHGAPVGSRGSVA